MHPNLSICLIHYYFTLTLDIFNLSSSAQNTVLIVCEFKLTSFYFYEEYFENNEVAENNFTDIQQYQEEAWRAICGSEQLDDHLMISTSNQWCPVSPIRFSHINPLQLQATSSYLQSRSPSISMATNFLPSTVPDTDILSLNHIQTQPVYYTPPGYAVNLAPPTHMPPFSVENFLPLEVVSMVNSGHPQSIDAAQTLLTLRTGEE